MKKQQKHSARASINPACIYLIIVLTYLINTALSAAIITVNTLDNESNSDGDCSLREAILSANQNTSFDDCAAGSSVGTDSIFVAVSGTIAVTSALQITERVVIFGPARDGLTISGQNASGIFVVNMPDDTHDFDLKLMTIADASETLPGAALWLQRAGDVTIENARFENNHVTSASGSGGAIATTYPVGEFSSTMTIRRVEFIDNSAGVSGGAIDLPGDDSGGIDTLVIEESLFRGNTAGSFGGAIRVETFGSAVSIDRSVFVENQATGVSGFSNGGAIYLDHNSTPPPLALLNSSTFKGNTAIQGGAVVASDTNLLIENSTFEDNSATERGTAVWVLANPDDAVAAGLFFNTLLNESGPDVAIIEGFGGVSFGLSSNIIRALFVTAECFGELGVRFDSNGFNIDASGTCTGHATDLPMTDPKLSPLGDYGDGTTWAEIQTAHPLVTSPAIDGGSAGPCTGGFGATIATDQRGETRPVDGDGNGSAKCDIGAVEVQPGSEPASFVLTASVAGDGTIISDPPGIECLLDCDQPYLAGTSVSLSTVPQPGFQFVSWSGDCSGSGSCTVTMNGDRSVGATFEPATLTYPVDVELDGNGVGMVASMPPGIDCPSDCSEDFENNTSVVLMPVAGSASSFFGWRADCASAGTGDCQFNVDQPARAIAIFSDGDLLFLDGFE